MNPDPGGTSRFPTAVQAAIQKLSRHMMESLRPAVEDVVARKVVDEEILDAWCKCILTAKWTGALGSSPSVLLDFYKP